MRTLSLFFSFWIGITFLSIAQSVTFDPINFPGKEAELGQAIDAYEKGDRYYERGPHHFEKALDFYMQAHRFNPENGRLNFQIASIHEDMSRPDSAAHYMERAMVLDPQYKSFGVYLQAVQHHRNGEWQEAIQTYKEYIRLASVNLEFMDARQRLDLESDVAVINRRIIQCENGMVVAKDTLPIMVTNLGGPINSAFPDYAASVNADETYMIFTSRREGNTGGKRPKDEVFEYEDIYYSQRSEGGYWVPAQKLEGVNTKRHDGSVWLSPDATKMIMYRFKNNGDLYLSERNGGDWSKPEPMKMLNSKYREAHASMTADGKTIYFTSNNPELGTQSLDIYKVMLDTNTGEWTRPLNLGGIINTEYDEECVFVSEDGKTLYFSSEGHNSIGGKDVFKSELDEYGKWSKPVNMGYPMNSPAEDIFVSFIPGSDKVYMDSDRIQTTGDKDIFLIELLEGKTVPYYFVVMDSVTGETIEASVQVVGSKDQKEFKIYEQPDGHMAVLPVFQSFYIKATSLGYKSYIGSISTRYETADVTELRDTIYMNLGEDVVTLAGTVYDAFTREKITGKIEISSEDHFAQLIRADQSGRFKTAITPEQLYTIKVSAEGYEAVVEKAKFDVDPDIPEYIKDFYLDKLDFDKDYRLNNIYFDFDRATLRPASIKELRNLKFLLERYPDVRVELSAHTDNVGSRAYNQVLSRRRAESVVSWLIKNGIPKNRLVPKGYSFDKPVAPNDSPENRQLNRRVEFKFLRD